jgi:hypothetical protein
LGLGQSSGRKRERAIENGTQYQLIAANKDKNRDTIATPALWIRRAIYPCLPGGFGAAPASTAPEGPPNAPPPTSGAAPALIAPKAPVDPTAAPSGDTPCVAATPALTTAAAIVPVPLSAPCVVFTLVPSISMVIRTTTSLVGDQPFSTA